MDFEAVKKIATTVLAAEADAVAALKERIGRDFFDACVALHECRGRIVLMGVGKSGHIANKIASTLASTGSPAFYIHPTEAGHGDFGMLRPEDVAVVVSNSGETEELNMLLPPLKRMQIAVIALTGNAASKLARAADIRLDIGVAGEACPLGLAPTSSSMAALAMGDALAAALLNAKGLTAEDFARMHPGGRLGRRLLLRLGDLMRTGERIPSVPPDTPLTDALCEMSAKGLGMTVVVDAGAPVGVFTDGDLRRALDRRIDIHATPISAVMTRDFKRMSPDDLAVEALNLMETHAINSAPVVDADGKLVGALNLQDLLHAGL